LFKDKYKPFNNDTHFCIGRIHFINHVISFLPCSPVNLLFAGSHEVAKRAAMFYSFFGTCKKNNVNPYLWFKKVLEVIPAYPANKIGERLPQNPIKL
jgi:hypothetical protein